MRIARLIGYVMAGGALVLILLAVGAIVALSYIDFNRYKPLIADAMREATGRELIISGDLRPEISLSPGIAVDGVTLSNAEWGSRREMASVRRLEAKIAVSSAILGVVEFRRIELTGADILLEVDAQGRTNFDFLQPVSAPAGPDKLLEAGAAIDLLPLTSELRVRDSRLRYTNAVTGTTFAIEVESLVLRDGSPATPLTLAYAGRFNAVPIRVRGKLGGPAGPPVPGRPWPAELHIEGPADVAVTGSISDPFAGKGLDLAVSLRGEGISPLSDLAGVAIPELGPYSLSGRATGDITSTIHVAGLTAQLGASDVAGEATVRFAEDPPAVTATLVSGRLELPRWRGDISATLRDTAAAFSLSGRTLAVERFETDLFGARISVAGTIVDVIEVAGLELTASAEGERIGDLSEFAGRPLPALGSYALAGRVSGDLSSTIEISDLSARLGASDVAGALKISVAGERPVVAARLHSGTIDLAAFSPLRAPLRDAAAVLSLEGERLSIESFKATVSGATITARGSIAEPGKAGGLDLSAAAKGAQLADLSGLVGRAMPALGRYEIAMRLTGDATGSVRASDISGRVGKSDVRGNVNVALGGVRPFIDAVLASDNVDLAGLAGVRAGSDEQGQDRTTEKPDRLFSDAPLALEGLRSVDGKLQYNAGTLTGRTESFRNATVILSLKKGLLDVARFTAELLDGTVEGTLRLDGRTDRAEVVARAELQKIDVGAVMAQSTVAGTIEGRINLDLDVRGTGRSIRDIMAGLDGEVHLAMGKGKVRSRTLQRWVGGPTQILSNVLTLNVGGYSTINCALGAFDITQGLATSNGLLLDTDVAAFLGTGTVNLKTEALDIIIRPAVKRMTLSAAVPVHVRGTLMNPQYRLDEKAVARRFGGLLGGIVFPPALILGLGELGTFKDGDCVGAEAVAQDQGTPEQPEQTTGQKATRLPGRLIEGTGESITRGLRKLFGQ